VPRRVHDYIVRLYPCMSQLCSGAAASAQFQKTHLDLDRTAESSHRPPCRNIQLVNPFEDSHCVLSWPQNRKRWHRFPVGITAGAVLGSLEASFPIFPVQ
jgi:hypothetical protein